MARPLKEGLEYFIHDTNAHDDKKIKLLVSKFGIVGYGIYFYLIELAGKDNGYYLKLEADDRVILASDLNINRDELDKILEFMLQKDLFDKTIYKEHQILTSKRLQKSFLFATKRRASINFYSEYLLINPELCKPEKYKPSILITKLSEEKNTVLGVNVYNNSVNVYNNSPQEELTQHLSRSSVLNVDIGTQSRVEKSKEENNSLRARAREEIFPEEKTNQFESDSFKNFSEEEEKEFDTLWQKYGKPVGNKKAIKAYYLKIPPEERKKIIPHVEKYTQAYEPRFRKDLLNYLKLRSWNDEVFPKVNSPPNGTEPIQPHILRPDSPEAIEMVRSHREAKLKMQQKKQLREKQLHETSNSEKRIDYV